MICAGIDAGSRTIKVVLIDTESKRIIAKDIIDQGIEQSTLALELFENTLSKSGLKKQDVSFVVATGYGRNAIDFADTTITEITCHGVGVHHLVPDAMTIIDIGGQDSKLLRLDENGKVRDFVMNDRCAAGTGRFLEIVAQRLNVELDSIGKMAAKSKSPSPISSMCVVFAETEITGLLACGASRDDIAAGVQASIATRIAGMAGRRVMAPIVFTGGVALVPEMDNALKSALGHEITISPDPQTTGAFGAAILAARKLNGEHK
ncbi:MAG: 2-hydroxyglutaryl-CoA dehydratase [Sedimentisphaerales bacterium]|nr:2-hydroxyglutaryl-CoA dehydratase [Sedimentisphaerales bacterium]